MLSKFRCCPTDLNHKLHSSMENWKRTDYFMEKGDRHTEGGRERESQEEVIHSN